MSGGYWQKTDRYRRLTDKGEISGPRATTLEGAQAGANFVVLAPRALPAGCRIGEVTLRPDQPPGRPEGVEPSEIGAAPWTDANPASVRAVIEGEGRRLRLKQFLYDWSPPAASVAALWTSTLVE